MAHRSPRRVPLTRRSTTGGHAGCPSRRPASTPRGSSGTFNQVSNWGRWGPDDQLGTLNLITPERVVAAARLVRSGRHVSMSLPLDTVAGPDNPNPVIHHVIQGHGIDIGSGGVRFGFDYLGIAFHGDCHSHMDAMCHLSWQGRTYNGKPAQEVLTTRGATSLDVDAYATGLIGRGVLYDLPRSVAWSGSSPARP